MACLRKWLSRNKIFFEIFSFVFLGIASVIVSYYSWDISKKELKILEYQQQPILHIKVEEDLAGLAINIYNSGMPSLYVNVNPISISSVYNVNLQNDGDFGNYQFEIDEIFDKNPYLGNVVGKVATIPINGEVWEDFKNKKKKIDSSEFENYFLDNIFLISLTYSDHQGVKYNKFYKISNYYTTEINNDEHREIFDEFYGKRIRMNFNSFKNLSPAELVNKLTNEDL